MDNDSDSDGEISSPLPLRRRSHRIQGPDSDDEDAEPAVPMPHPDSAERIVIQQESVQMNQASPFVALAASAADRVVVINEPDLIAIGVHIRQIEEEVRAIQDANRHNWKQNIGPAIKKKIDEMSDSISKLTSRVDKEKDLGEAHLEALHAEIAVMEDLLDIEKMAYNFPTSRSTMGRGGLYIAFDDCRIEDVSGRFDLELIPVMGADVGRISFALSGNSYYEMLRVHVLD